MVHDVLARALRSFDVARGARPGPGRDAIEILEVRGPAEARIRSEVAVTVENLSDVPVVLDVAVRDDEGQLVRFREQFLPAASQRTLSAELIPDSLRGESRATVLDVAAPVAGAPTPRRDRPELPGRRRGRGPPFTPPGPPPGKGPPGGSPGQQ